MDPPVVGTGGNLGLSKHYHKKLFGPLFYTRWNCPLIMCQIIERASENCL